MSYELLPKEILYDGEMLDRLESGVKAVHDAVGRTMGPSGQLVMFEEDSKIPYPIITKDGVSVASMIAFKEQAKDNGAQFVIQAARKQVYETGDGTTLTSILTYKLFKEGRKLIAAGYAPNELIGDMRDAITDTVNYIKERSVTNLDLTTLKTIARVATNNDKAIADLIAEAVEKTGKYGLVSLANSPKEEHSVEYQDGYQLDIGILDKTFANVDGRELQLSKPYILITDQNIYDFNSLLPLLRLISADIGEGEKPNIIIFAPQISSEVLQVMKRNITDPEGLFFMVHIRPSKDLSPDKNRMIFEDLAAITGGTFVSKDSGYQIDKLSLEHLGTCGGVGSYPGKTLITGFDFKVAARMGSLQGVRELTDDDFTKDLIDKSLAKLSGGVAIIKVGGRNMTEQAEIKARVDDAVKACKSAQEMGYVRGGGVAMLQAYQELKPKNAFSVPGYDIVLESLKYPAKVILTNAKREDWQGIISSIVRDTKCLGYNIKDGTVTADMYDLHIIDPTKVIVYALKNAASAAISMLQTSVMIIAEREDTDA